MKNHFLINFIYTLFAILITNCQSSPTNTKENKDLSRPKHQDSVPANRSATQIADTNYKGIMMIEEQPVLAILDSATPQNAATVMQKNYDKILKDAEYLNVPMAEQPGCIFYSSSPEKIVFETFMFLKSKPVKQPKYSQPVILEKTLGLLYDHYGTFNTIHRSYTNIQNIMREIGYKQIGPSREIYVLADDTAKWRTRIIIPVVKEK
ncbi:MAG: hypothetical protein Fur0023_05150 [Bacteroidia bacterium]